MDGGKSHREDEDRRGREREQDIEGSPPCGDAPAAGVVAAAKREGEIVIYGPPGRQYREALVGPFERAYPGIKVELLMTDRVLDLSNGEADVAVRGGEAQEKALVGKKIADVPTREGVDRAWIGPGVLYFDRLAARASQSRLSKIVSLPIYRSLTIRN